MAPEGCTQLPRPGVRVSQTVYLRSWGGKAGDARISQAHAFLAGHRSALEHSADGLDRLAHHRVGEVGVLERGVRACLSEQPADGEDALALPQGDGGVGGTKVM